MGEKQIINEAEEKWNRLTNPKSVEDYGLSLTESEMVTFPEGRKIIAGIKRDVAFLETVEKMGDFAKQSINKTAFEVLMEERNETKSDKETCKR